MTPEPAQLEDAPALARLHAQVFETSVWKEPFWEDAVLDVRATVLVTRDGDELNGVIAARAIGDEAEILTVAVRPSARGTGVASQLLAAAMAELRAAEVARVFLEVAEGNAPAEALYRRAGFTPVGRRRAYYGDGRDAVVMECRPALASDGDRAVDG